MTTLSSLEKQWCEIQREWNGGRILPGRNDRPAVLFDSYWSQAFGEDLDLLAIAVEDAWTSAEFPARLVDEESWLTFFDEFPFLDNHTIMPNTPATIPTLYRACAEGYENGMAWTDDYEQALWFYRRNLTFGNTTVMLKLNPQRAEVLAHFHGEGGRNENEWIVHPVATEAAEQIEVTA